MRSENPHPPCYIALACYPKQSGQVVDLKFQVCNNCRSILSSEGGLRSPEEVAYVSPWYLLIYMSEFVYSRLRAGVAKNKWLHQFCIKDLKYLHKMTL